MSTAFNTHDVPLVSAHDLALPMQYMIRSGRGLALLRGASDRELREAEHAMWDHIEGSPHARTAVFVRFRCLVAVFAAARLRRMLLLRGFILIAPALQVAAKMRLNTRWGFNPMKFALALEALLAQGDERVIARRVARGRPIEAAAA
jgi:hypothetical protein